MNGPLQRLRELVSRSSSSVSISDIALSRYNSVVTEYNSHLDDPEWYSTPRAQACVDFIEWFDEVHE